MDDFNDFDDFMDCDIKMPLIGDTAPAFHASSTNGPIDFPGDCAGQWIILFSHPSDFTPVCTSEFIAFQRDLTEFEKLNTRLIGLSVGGLASHLAWFDAIANMPGGINITFALIDDLNMSVAKKYGMMHPGVSDTHAVRAVFIIDPDAVVRAILYYPAVLGRNMAEIWRMLVGLQTADAFGVAIPANWTPGANVLRPAPVTAMQMRRNKNAHPWFMNYKPLDKQEIYDKICKK